MSRWRTTLPLLFVALSAAGAMVRAAGEDPLREARDLLDAKRYDAAAAILDAAVVANPDDADALALRAELRRAIGRLDDARSDYERVTSLRPDATDAWFWLGTIRRWQGRDAAAVEAYGSAIGLSPCHLDSLKGRARSLRNRGDAARAEADLVAALRCSPGDEEASELLAGALAAGGDRAGAESVLRGAFRGAGLEERIGDLDLDAGRPRAAAARYRGALEAEPGVAGTWRKLGDAEREHGRTEAALDAYRRASELDPSDAGSLYWIGTLASRLDRRDEAAGAFDAILSRHPDDSGALVAKARLARAEGRSDEALDILDRVLAREPDDGEARVLRAAILASRGRVSEARNEYRAVLGAHPDDGDAREGLERLPAARYVGIEGGIDRSRVIEGLEGASTIAPARVEYVNDGGGIEYRQPVRDGVDLLAYAGMAREAVYDLGLLGGGPPSPIYDFDVLRARAGLSSRLGERWGLDWYAGGSRYEPRLAGTLASETHFEGGATLEGTWPRDTLTIDAATGAFLKRGYAAETQFRIFDRQRLNVGWAHTLGRGFAFEASAGVSNFDDGSTPVFASAGLGWERGERGVWLRYRHDPVDSRFLGDDRELDFIDYDALSLRGWTPLAWGFRLSGEALAGRYGPTVNLNEGSFERNEQRLLRAALSWSPGSFEPLTLGAEYLSDHYDFDAEPYNNMNIHSWTLFADLDGRIGERWRYAARYAHAFIGDERDGSYPEDALSGRIECSLGRLDRRAGPVRIGAEARYWTRSLHYEGGRPGEDGRHYRAFVTVPF